MRLQQLTPGVSLLGAITWQYSFNTLLSSEQFGVGGSQFVRAYDSSEITGEHGVAFKLEVQYAQKPGMKYLKEYQEYIFFDFGSAWTTDTAVGSDSQNDITSIGFGVRYNFTRWISGFVEVAIPMGRDVGAEGDDDPRFFFSLAARY